MLPIHFFKGTRMIAFGNILHFPANYKNREKNLKNINLIEFEKKYNDTEFKFIIKGLIVGKNRYTPEIEVYTATGIHITSPVKIFCNCDSFKFEFAYAVAKYDSLLHPENFILHRPKEKNQFVTASGCKHIIALAKYSTIKLK
jgi:hypothetical protein